MKWNITKREKLEIIEIKTNYTHIWDVIKSISKTLQNTWDKDEINSCERELLRIGKDAAIYRKYKSEEEINKWKDDYQYERFDWKI